MKKQAQQLKLLILVLGLVIYACDTAKENNKTQIDTKNIINLEIRLPFESSNDDYEGEINFELHNVQGEKLESEFDTVTKTGGHIKYSLEKGKYSYSIKTPFNEVIKRSINVEKDTVYNFYEACYDKVKKFSLSDLKNAKKINISVAYQFDELAKDELEIERKGKQYLIRFKENNTWTNKKAIDSLQIIRSLRKFEDDIMRMSKNKIFGTETYSYLTASQVFIKYDNKLYEVHNLKHDSLFKVTNELKQKI